MAPRVQGKIVERETGARVLVIEQRGRDIHTGKLKTLHAAIGEGIAGVAADRTLLQAAQKRDVTIVMIVIEEIRTVYLAPLSQFFDADLSRGKADWRGRSVRILAYENVRRIYLGPRLRKRQKRVRANA